MRRVPQHVRSPRHGELFCPRQQHTPCCTDIHPSAALPTVPAMTLLYVGLACMCVFHACCHSAVAAHAHGSQPSFPSSSCDWTQCNAAVRSCMDFKAAIYAHPAARLSLCCTVMPCLPAHRRHASTTSAWAASGSGPTRASAPAHRAVPHSRPSSRRTPGKLAAGAYTYSSIEHSF